MTLNQHTRSTHRPVTAAACCGLAALSAVGLHAADAAAPEPKKPAWETSAGVGLTLTEGNSQSVTVTANVVTQYKAEKSEVRAGADAGYGEATPRKTEADRDPDSEKNSDFIRGFGQYNRLFSERLYAYGRVDAVHDDIADVMYRISLSPGAGYYFIKKPNLTLSGELGPGYVFEKVGYDENDYASLRVGERFEWKFSKTARLWQSAEWVPEVTDFENFILTFELGVAAALTERLELRVVLTDTYDNMPAVYSWGEEYEKNDLKIMAGVNYKF